MARPPAIETFLARLPASLAASFSPAQLDAIELHFAMRHRPTHTIDWRHRIARFYIILLAGHSQRAD